jgi:sterol desaturase/sphingolipid hydroxylase (fatty acid hydroxylase superfamily)
VVKWLIEHEAQVRLATFLLVFAALSVLQQVWPRRDVPGGWRRFATHIALVVVGTAILRVAFPLLAVGLAVRIDQSGGGLMGALPPVAGVIAGVILLDLVIYWQHRLLHRIPLLWRLHRVHHADTGFDVSTGLRFHPFESVLSMVIKLVAIVLLGIAPLAVLIFELALSIGSLFTHANICLPAGFERRLRWVFVTPEMHRVHHSWHPDETDSNFSFHLSLWDRLFGTYRDQPRNGHVQMVIGLPEFRDSGDQSLAALLLNPWK